MLLFAAIIDRLGVKILPEKQAPSGDDEEKKWRQYVSFLLLVMHMLIFAVVCC